jgi:hypothetical protein
MKSFTSIRTLLVAAAVAGTAGLVSSCKDYLEIDPTSLNTTEYTFSTVAGATAAVVGAYDPLSGDAGYGTRVSMYFPYDTDEMISSAGPPDLVRRSITRYLMLPNNTEITNPWNQLYQGVERSNICIQQIPRMDLYKNGSAADTAALHRLHGEALTLRAQYYFELIRNWGDVPAQFEPSVTGQDFNLPNADRNATYDTLLVSLVKAEKLLPWRSKVGVSSERITKGAAKALRARIALFRGGYRANARTGQMERPSDYRTYYTIARQECAQLMANRTEHTLNTSFLEVFKSINELRSESSNEIMFQVGMASATGPSGSKLGYYNGPRLTSSPLYGSSQGAVTIAPPYFYAFDSTDTRRDVTITTYNYPSTNFQTGVALTSVTDGKFRRDWRTPPMANAVNYLDYNWPIIRFADVLLMFAEADNEVNNGPSQAAQDALMEVRTRGFGGNRARALATLTQQGFSLSGKDNFFKALTNERYVEFGSEGIRKYDLLRWNLLEAKLTEVKANIEKMAKGEAPYDNVPLYMYYRIPTAIGNIQWTRSFYRPSPTPNTAPAGTTRVNWRQAINGAYVANTKPAGTTYSLTPGGTVETSVGSGLAAEYVPGKGKELMPIPQSTISSDPAVQQNFGY